MSENLTQPGSRRVIIVFKGIGVSYLVTIPLFAVFSLILSKMVFPEKYIEPVVLLITVVSIFIAGILTSLGLKNRGWINGVVVGLVYMLVLYVLSSVVYGSFTLDRHVVTMVLIGSIVGGIGGIIGINMKRSKNKYSH